MKSDDLDLELGGTFLNPRWKRQLASRANPNLTSNLVDFSELSGDGTSI